MKIAIFFPGIGYHCDKSLLYYSGKISDQYQYKCIRITYTNLSKSIMEAFEGALDQTENCLEAIHWNEYEDILFISKSIGTIVASAYAKKYDIQCRNIYYTPLEQTFDFCPQSGIVFHGSDDAWAETPMIERKCQENNLSLYRIENANHSLEIKNDMHKTLGILEEVMELSEEYIAYDIHYRQLHENEICSELFSQFIRHQDVTKCWRKEGGNWVVKEDLFIDDWTEEDYQTLVACLKNTVQTGGFVYASFCGNVLKGFVSVEPVLFGKAQEYLDLSSIHVSQDMRGKGIGKSLFRAAKNWAKKRGAKKLYISAHSAVETQAFYKSMGCTEAQEYNQNHVEKEPYDCQLECIIV